MPAPRTLSTLALLLSAACAAASPEGDVPPDPAQAELVLRTRLEDAARTERWGDLSDAYRELRRRGLAQDDTRLLVRYAQARLVLRDLSGAEAALDEVLRARPDHVVALPLQARVRASKGELKGAGELLVLAARSGRLVLADLSAEPTDGALRPLLRDPAFILRVMTAAQGEEPPARTRRHDPFAMPRSGGDEGGRLDDGAGRAEEEREALRRELHALFDAILARAAAQDVAGIERAFRDLRALLARCEARLAHDELEAARARFEGLQDVYHALQLQVFVHEGNVHLRAAHAAMDERRWADALGAAAAIEGVARRLRGVDRPSFARNAEAFELRARDLAHQARLEQEIAALRLDVTGIVLPPPGAEPRKAIVNDRIYAEGAWVLDGDGDPIEDLRVVQVASSAVRFRYREREFVRPLKPRM